MHEDAAIEGDAVATAWLFPLTVEIKFPPLSWAKTDGSGVRNREFPPEDRHALGTHQEHVVIADPGDGTVACDGADENVSLGRCIKIEEGQHTRVRKLLRVERARAVEDHDVRTVSDVLLREVVPHRHHRREDIHGAQSRFFTRREGGMGEAIPNGREQGLSRKTKAVPLKHVAEHLVVGAGHFRDQTKCSMGKISACHKLILVAVKRVYFERLAGVPLVPLLLPNLREDLPTRQLFQKEAFRDLRAPLVEIVDDPARADVHLLPHNYPLVAGNAAYLRRCQETAARHGKKIVVFWNGDGTGPVALENAVVFRTSQYESKLRKREIIMPAYAEDLKGKGLFVRDKTEMPPVIGFCGWAQYKNVKNALGSFLQALPHEAYALLTGYPQSRSFIKGLSLRRRILPRLQKSALVRTNFLIRSSHSAHAKTIRLDPLQARREYIENMLASDFVLSIRGDGNYSLRFYEALSLGRVPILLNTDVRLPLSDIVEYSSFILQIHIADMYRIDEIVADFWSHQTDESWFIMQVQARNAFEKYLSAPRFLAYAVEHLF